MARPHRGWILRTAVPLGLLTTLALAGCSSERTKSLDTLDAKGENAASINELGFPIYAAAVIVAVLVIAAVLFIVVKFRQRPDEDDELPTQLHGNTKLEITWTMIPALILVAFAVPTVLLIQDLNAEAKDSITVTHRNGEALTPTLTYGLDGPGRRGPTGIVLGLVEVQ